LAGQTLARLAVAAERRRQHLERDGPSEPRVVRGVDDAHPAASDFFADLVRTDALAAQKARVRGLEQQIRRRGPGRLLEEAIRSIVRAEERADFSRDGGIVDLRLGDDALAIRWIGVERALKDFGDALPGAVHLSGSQGSLGSRGSRGWGSGFR